MKVDAVIVAAGASTRFGQDKLLTELCGRTVLERSVAVYASSETIGGIVLVVAPGREAELKAAVEAAAGGKLAGVVAGGERRRDSVEAGLRACRSRYVAVHDGARPLVTRELVERVVAGAEGKPGAIAAVPVTDSIKEVRDGVIVGHPERESLWAAQTPQVVLRQAWLDAAGMSDNDETDDAAMLARLGLACVVVEGDAENIKITRPLDLEVARAILRARGI